MIQFEAEAGDSLCSVLLADDDRGFCSSLSDVLESAHHRVDVVHSGNEALTACAEQRSYDVLLLDVNLPDLSGLELIPQIEELLPELEILVITGHASMASAVQAVSRSTIGYLIKPLDLEKLLAVHEKVARRKRMSLENQRITAEREGLIRELEDKNAELERYAYTVSHDLKSPLVTIKGFLGLLEKDLEESDPEQTRADMAHIYGAADQMAQLLDGLLELSRIGRLVHEPELVSLGELAEEAVSLLSGPTVEHSVDVRIASDMPTVRGDRLRLLTVLQNLVDNAIKSVRDRQRPRVEIGSRRNGEETICYVRDNGTGIDPRYQEKIFGLFEQLERNGAGTGIGLTLARRIVEAHGGRIWVESEGLGKGSTFCFVLPG